MKKTSVVLRVQTAGAMTARELSNFLVVAAPDAVIVFQEVGGRVSYTINHVRMGCGIKKTEDVPGYVYLESE